VREIALGFEREDLASAFRQKEHLTFEQFLHVIDDRTQGALRVSVGLASNFADVYRLLQFAQSMIDRSFPPSPVMPSKLAPAIIPSICVCGYHDTRRERRFCPHCGRSLSSV
jgi:hypothetical protein